jgi:DNA-directed RNA polymerase subunit M/transcription elongation factor TFIIS
MVANPKQFRANIVSKLQKHLPFIPYLSANNVQNLEIGIFNWTIKEAKRLKIIKKWDNPFFVQIYADHLRSIFCNLTADNTYLLSRLKSDDIAFKDIAFLTHQEMKPDKWEPIIASHMTRNKNRFGAELVASTTQFTCGKCGSNQCSYYLLQTRGADEPMTAYITCCACGKRWKRG